MLRREVMKMGAGLFGLGAGTPSRFPYPGRPQPSPGVAPSPGIVVRANRVIVTGPNGGIFVYSGTPAAGNLIASITGAAGSDAFGNVYLQGTAEYSYVGVTPNSASRQLGGVVQYFNWTGSNWGSPVASVGSGSTTILQLQGATKTQVTGTPFDASNGATVELGLAVTGGTTTDTLAVTGETTLTPVVMSGHPVIEQTDHTILTATAASNTAVTTAWPIPANDAQVGTVYRLKAGGYGDQGSTAETLKAQLTFMGVNVGSDTLPSTFMPVSTQFLWRFEGEVMVITTGAAGTVRASGEFKVWELNGPNSFTMVIGQHAALPPAADSTVNTTTAQTMSLGASWGSTTGAPTITGAWSTLARAGA